MRCSSKLSAILALCIASATGARGQGELGTQPAAETPPKSWSSAIATAGERRAVSTICQFLSGPKAHGWHDYAPLAPAVLGSSCQDGIGSAGVVVAAGHGQQY